MLQIQVIFNALKLMLFGVFFLSHSCFAVMDKSINFVFTRCSCLRQTSTVPNKIQFTNETLVLKFS